MFPPSLAKNAQIPPPPPQTQQRSNNAKRCICPHSHVTFLKLILFKKTLQTLTAALAIPAAGLKATASCGSPTPSLPGITALQRGQPSAACTCSQATSSNELVHQQTCQYQALIQLPVLCKQIHSQFINSFSCQHKTQQIFYFFSPPENHPQITASYLLTTPVCSCASPSGQHDHPCHPTAS